MIYKTFRTEATINEYQMAAFLWDGLNHILGGDALQELLGGARLTSSLANRAIREALGRQGEDSVSCGPTYTQSDTAAEWCAEQIWRLYGPRT